MTPPPGARVFKVANQGDVEVTKCAGSGSRPSDLIN